MNATEMKALRERYGILVRDMAVSVRIPFGTYQDIENGRVKASRPQMVRIQDVFDRHARQMQKRLDKWNAAAGEKGGVK